MTQTMAPAMVTLSLPYDVDAIEIRRRAAPRARWIGYARAWEMTAEDAEAWAVAMEESVADLADYVERRRSSGAASLRLRADAERVRRARGYAAAIRSQVSAVAAPVAAVSAPVRVGYAEGMCCCGLRARDSGCSCES